MSYLTITKKWPKGISAIMLMIISMILFLFPMNALIQILGKQFTKFTKYIHLCAKIYT